jgi:Methyltransferase domain
MARTASVKVFAGPVTSGRALQVSYRSEQVTDTARHYAFPHSGADERRRLELFAERLDPLTVRRIKSLGLAPGARCLEVGGGRGLTSDEFPDRSFDLVHVRAVLMHIPDRMAVLRETVRANVLSHR